MIRIFFLAMIALWALMPKAILVAQDSTLVVSPDTLLKLLSFTEEQQQKLSQRGIKDLLSIQAGVVSNEGSSSFHVRGGRNGDVTFLIDGVRVSVGETNLPQAAFESVDFHLGSFDAKYGDALTGVVELKTKSVGSQSYGSLEMISSELTDPYGYNLGEFSLGLPIVGDKLGIFIAGNIEKKLDGNPSAIDAIRLKDDLYEDLKQNPQAMRFRNQETGETRYVTLPSNLASNTRVDDLRDLLISQNDLAGFTMDRFPLDRAEILPISSYELNPLKQSSQSNDLNLLGKLILKPTNSTTAIFGGRLAQGDFRSYSPSRSIFSHESNLMNERSSLNLNARLSQSISPNVNFELSVDLSTREGNGHDPGFSSDVRDVLFYGDYDHEANAVWRNYFYTQGDSTFSNGFGDGSPPSTLGTYSIYSQPGARGNGFYKFKRQSALIQANARVQTDLHRIEFGAEYESSTNRHYSVSSQSSVAWARFFDDGRVESGNGIDSWSEMDYRDIATSIDYYGYDFLGLEEVDEQDPDNFETDYNSAPHKPIYLAGYIQDNFKLGSLSLRLGLRVDYYDNNSLVLKDRWALKPISRAGTISDRPTNIGDDFAVYYGHTGSIVGYRSLDGEFFDSYGNREHAGIIDIRGKVNKTGEFGASVFQDYKSRINLSPRIGLSYQIGNKLALYSRIGRSSLRPNSTVAFESLENYFQTSQANGSVINPDLDLQRVSYLELGVKLRRDHALEVGISFFFNKFENLNEVAAINFAFPRGYRSNNDVGLSESKGIEADIEFRPRKEVTVWANYTLSRTSRIGRLITNTWVGSDFEIPDHNENFDRRHSTNLGIRFQNNNDAGPNIGGLFPLGNLTLDVNGSYRTGQPFTALSVPGALFRASSLTVSPRGGTNAFNIASSSLINLQLEKSFSMTDFGSITAFLWVQNLLDNDNVFSVWGFSNQADNDGWSSSREGQDFFNNGAEPESNAFLYDQRDNLSSNYGIPRMTRLGIRLSF